MQWYFFIARVFISFACNTAMSAMVYYTPPGYSILNSSRFPGDRNRASALHQGKMHLHLITRYPRGVVGKVLVYHLNVTGSIPTPAMIFLLGFHQSSSFSLERDRERVSKKKRKGERERED
jgi:hypothetical protein